uniref:beclin-2 n=1 Tax=Jaculus jaculus TaxID=51337 RepID=UPI001E1B610D|nr:beclin-2 [Jaculus jaculus]
MSASRFLCQRCSQPLRHDAVREERPGPAQEQPAEVHDGRGPSTQTALAENLPVEASQRSISDSDSSARKDAIHFILLGEMLSLKTLSSIQKTTVDMSDILSGEKSLDHPLCAECMDSLLAHVDAQLAAAERDSERYGRCLEGRRLAREEEEEEERRALHAELRALQQEEAGLARVLEDVDGHVATLEAELRAVEAEAEELCQQERRYRAEYCALKWQQLELADDLSSLKNRLRHTKRQLERLSKTSIFSATFAIWENGPLGVINHFRLGRLPGVRVAWGEINSAWGQAALLLLALSRKVGLQFQRYQLVPNGSRSYLRALTGDLAVLPLFSDGSHNVFFNNNFDRAMTAFLDCLQQFAQEAGQGEPGLRLPHRVCVREGALHEAGDAGRLWPIRTHLNTEQHWTRALKLMLVNLKWSLSWASTRNCQN